MNLFRSEEHITQWLAGRAPGATIDVTKLSELAHAWWAIAWHRHGARTTWSRTRRSSPISG